jgi:hypothetical protein
MINLEQTPLFRIRWLYLMIFTIAVMIYSNTFKHGFVLDDDVVVVKNQFVQEGIRGIPDIFSHGFLYGFNQRNDQSYRPIVLLSFAIDRSLFGNDPVVMHIFNVLLYALVCCLLFRFLLQIFRAEHFWLSFWAALLFTLHPIHTEVVANIKGRDELLHAFFMLVTLIWILDYYDHDNKVKLVLALLSFFLALMSKEMAVTLLGILPITLRFFRVIGARDIAKVTAMLFGVFFLYLAIRNTVLDTITFDERMSIINNSIAAATTYGEQLATTFYILGKYILLLVFPHPLAWDYSFPHFPIVGLDHPIVIFIMVTFLFCLIASIRGVKTKNIFAYCFIFFVLSFSVVSNFFILIGSTMGERFLFFPSIAFCILIVHAVKKGFSLIWNSPVKRQLISQIFFSLLLIGYAIKTYSRNFDWESNYTLFHAGAEATPENSRAISALGTIYREEGENSVNPQVKISSFEKAVKAYKRSVELYEENTDAWYNLGVTYMNMNDQEGARQAFEKTLELHPNHLNALNNLGVIHFKNRNYIEAEKLFQASLRVNLNFQNGYANLGAVYHNLGQYDKARRYYTKALQLNPADQSTRANMQQLPN